MERTEKHFYDLRDLGWDKEYENEYKRCSGTYDVGRVAVQYKNLYKVYWAKGTAGLDIRENELRNC